jgi:hypothetical protein
MHVLWSSAHADDNSGPGGLLLEEIPGILNIGADREPVAGEITVRQPQLVQGSQSTARSLRVQSHQLLAESQIFKDEVLVRAESADHPAEEMSERRDHGKNLTGTLRIRRCAKSIILQVYDVLARHTLERRLRR